MINKNKLDLLVKQSKFNKDISLIIDIISPFIVDKAKITKREIDKANDALLKAFGTYKTENDKQWAKYTIYTQDFSNYKTITIYCHDRCISNENGTGYIPEYTRTMYPENGIFTLECLNKWKYEAKYTPTKAQIKASYKKYEELNEKIRELENKKSNLTFHYYFR